MILNFKTVLNIDVIEKNYIASQRKLSTCLSSANTKITPPGTQKKTHSNTPIVSTKAVKSSPNPPHTIQFPKPRKSIQLYKINE